MATRDDDLRKIVALASERGLPASEIQRLITRYDAQRYTPPPYAARAGMIPQSTVEGDPVGILPGSQSEAFKARLDRFPTPDEIATGVGDFAQGAASSWYGLGSRARQSLSPELAAAAESTSIYRPQTLSDVASGRPRVPVPDSRAGRWGEVAGDISQYVIPGTRVAKLVTKAPALVRMGAHALTDATVTGVKTGNLQDAARSGAISGTLEGIIPGGRALARVGRHLSQTTAPNLVRAALKPTIAALRKVTGQGGTDAKANALVRFLLDNNITTPEQARNLLVSAGKEIDALVGGVWAKGAYVPSGAGGTSTNAAIRAKRYLEALRRNAATQGLPEADVAMITRKIEELLRGPMGVDRLFSATRAPRSSVPAAEALGSARAGSRWQRNKNWNEMGSAEQEAHKAVERAQRDAVKAALPETRRPFHLQSRAIESIDVLDRFAQRTRNRDVIGLPAYVVGAGELASGKLPVLAVLTNMLRNGQFPLGRMAHRVGKILAQSDATAAADLLKRLGVAIGANAGRSNVPNMAGTPSGVGKQFTSGPFEGQTWTVVDGRPQRVN
jgi:hypothetical protein